MKKCCQIIVSGKVQNVGYRFYTQKRAQELGLAGFVQNRSDGSVFIEVEGEQSVLELFRDWCEQGPAWARVESLSWDEIPVVDYEGFTIR